MSKEEEEEFSDIPLADAIDIAILMHREVHFGGKFEFMQEYYAKEGVGVCEAFEKERIDALAKLEQGLGQNLAPTLLSGAAAEQIARAKEAYKKLRDIYELPETKNHYPRLIADLILAEEEFPQKEINAVVKEKGAIVPFLMDLLRAEDFHDPLFPGYGLAPMRAMRCLGLIGDKRAVVGLFEMIGEGDFFEENVALEALAVIGNQAKEFLLRVLRSHPITYDNERAAVALLQFKDDPEIADIFFEILNKLDLKHNALLGTHLVLGCEQLIAPEKRQAFTALAHHPETPSSLKLDMEMVMKAWNMQ